MSQPNKVDFGCFLELSLSFFFELARSLGGWVLTNYLVTPSKAELELT